MSTQRLLAAIMFTDIEGYTAMMQTNEQLAIQIRERHRQIFDSITEKYHGRILQYYGDGTGTNWCLGYAYGRAGRIEEAQSIVDYHLQKVKSEYVPAIMISAIYMGMGRIEEAIQWLERAMDEGVAPILFPEVTMGIKFEPLRSDPRFRDILKRGSSAKTTAI